MLKCSFVVGVILLGSAHAAPMCTQEGSTSAETACLIKATGKYEAELATYLSAAQSSIKASDGKTLNLQQSQDAWLAYRKAHCGDVYNDWYPGTMRYRAAALCNIALTRSRTIAIWDAYLALPGPSIAILPRPDEFVPSR